MFIVKRKPIFEAVGLVILFFADALQKWWGGFAYLDEIVAIVFGACFVTKSFKSGISKVDFRICIMVGVLCVIGFCGNYQSNVQDSYLYQILDAFNIFKYVLVVLGASIYYRRGKENQAVICYTARVVRMVVAISTVLMVLNLFWDIGMHTGYRMGMRTYNFVFSRVGGFYNACVIWLAILTAERYYNNSNSSMLYIVLVLINMCATMRSRAIGFAFLYVILFYLLIIKEYRRVKWYYVFFILVILVAFSHNQIQYYFSGERARNILLRYGVVTAKKYFPLGAGFAAYGTAIARDTYSMLYDRYGFSEYYGLSREMGDFLTDGFWPAILGEFGFIGLLGMLMLIGTIANKLLSEVENKYSRVCIVFILGTLALSSTVSSSFFSCSQLMVFACLTCSLKEKQKNNYLIE